MTGTPPDERLPAQTILDALGHAVIVTGPDGVVRYWNPEAERLYGWSADEAVGRVINTLTVPEVTQETAEEIMAALRDGDAWSGGFTVRRKDGSTFPALVTDTVVRDRSGAIVGIVGVSSDLGRALRPLLAYSADAALVLTRAAAITFVSPAASRLLGWRGPTLIGTSLWDLVHPEDRSAVVECHRRATVSPRASAATECRLRREDGTWCWSEVQFTDFLGDPWVRGVVCNVRDVTSRRQDRDELVRLTEQLRSALTSRVLIEQAKGLIAGRVGTDVDTAFQILLRHARDTNQKLHDVARAVLDGDVRLTR